MTPVHRPARPTLVLLAPLLVAGAALAIGWEITRSRAGEPGLRAMLAGAGLVLGVVYVTLVPVVRKMAVAEPSARLTMAMRAAGQRFVLTLLLAGIVSWRSGLHTRSFLLWTAVTYVLVVQAETIALVAWLRKSGK